MQFFLKTYKQIWVKEDHKPKKTDLKFPGLITTLYEHFKADVKNQVKEDYSSWIYSLSNWEDCKKRAGVTAKTLQRKEEEENRGKEKKKYQRGKKIARPDPVVTKQLLGVKVVEKGIVIREATTHAGVELRKEVEAQNPITLRRSGRVVRGKKKIIETSTESDSDDSVMREVDKVAQEARDEEARRVIEEVNLVQRLNAKASAPPPQLPIVKKLTVRRRLIDEEEDVETIPLTEFMPILESLPKEAVELQPLGMISEEEEEPTVPVNSPMLEKVIEKIMKE